MEVERDGRTAATLKKAWVNGLRARRRRSTRESISRWQLSPLSQTQRVMQIRCVGDRRRRIEMSRPKVSTFLTRDSVRTAAHAAPLGRVRAEAGNGNRFAT